MEVLGRVFRLRPRRLAMSLGLCLLVASLSAEDLVDRRLFIEAPSGFPSPSWVSALVAEAVRAGGTPLVVDDPAEADAILSLAFVAAEGAGGQAVATLRDLAPGSQPATSRFELSSSDSSELIDRLALPLASAIAKALPPVAQRLRFEETLRTVEKVTMLEQARGVTITLRGPPGAMLRFPDGRSAKVGADGHYAIADVPQDSSIVVKVRAPGHYETERGFRAGSADETFELVPLPIPRLDLRLGAFTGIPNLESVLNDFELVYGLQPGHLGLGLGARIHFPVFGDQGGRPFFVQPRLSILYQFLPPDWIVGLRAGASLHTRYNFDQAVSRVFAGLEFPLSVELKFGHGFAVWLSSSYAIYFGDPFIDTNKDSDGNFFPISGFDIAGGPNLQSFQELAPGSGWAWMANYTVQRMGLTISF